MAPEQLEGLEADARTDVFGFGCVLYEMLSGQKAFQARSSASLLTAIMVSEPRARKPAAALDPGAGRRGDRALPPQGPGRPLAIVRSASRRVDANCSDGAIVTATFAGGGSRPVPWSLRCC